MNTPHWADLGAFAATLAGIVVAVGVGIWRGTAYLKRRSLLGALFEVESTLACFSTSPDQQKLDLTLRLVIDSYIEWIALRFEGGEGLTRNHGSL